MRKKLNFLCISAALLSAAMCGCGDNSSVITADVEDTPAENTYTEAEYVTQTTATETAAEKPDTVLDEQSALEKLIAETAGNQEGCTVQSPLFGDFDGDGKNELIAIYGNKEYATSEDYFFGKIWFASGNKAESIWDGDGWDWITPEIVISCGDTFVKFERLYITGLNSVYCLIKDSTAEIAAIPFYAMGFYPDGEYGDFRASYNPDEEYQRSEEIVAYERYWFYYLNGEFSEYGGRGITEKEFLEYDGAQAVLDEIAESGFDVKNILKRSNGIINVNGVAADETYCYRTLKYRNGKVFLIDWYDDGVYVDAIFHDDYEQTDFERFSEMIYDTAEGNENSAVRERFFGDFNDDGKNELYAYYGTDEKFSMWLADENGAREAAEEELAGIPQN